MQLLSLHRTVFAIMLLIWGTLAEVQDDDIDTIRKELEQKKETMIFLRNEAKIELPALKRRLGTPCDKHATHCAVGFTAELSQHQKYLPLNTVVFDKVLENHGGGYNSNTGVFRAPSRGMYLFSVTIHSQPRYPVQLELRKNLSYIGRVVAGNSNSDWGDSGSVSVITTMNTNDEVFVRSVFSSNIYGKQWSSFMGVRIASF